MHKLGSLPSLSLVGIVAPGLRVVATHIWLRFRLDSRPISLAKKPILAAGWRRMPATTIGGLAWFPFRSASLRDMPAFANQNATNCWRFQRWPPPHRLIHHPPFSTQHPPFAWDSSTVCHPPLSFIESNRFIVVPICNFDSTFSFHFASVCSVRQRELRAASGGGPTGGLS